MLNRQAILYAAFDKLNDPLFVLGPDRQCAFANQAFFAFFGLSPGQGCSVSTEEFWPDVGSADLNRTEMACELRLRRGEVFMVKLLVQPLPEGFHLVQVLAGLSRNESLKSFHAQRLETLGLLASGVAHDFNNVLTGILGHITYLKTILPGKGAHSESLLAIEEGAKRASSLTQQILSFSKLDVAERLVRINLCDLVARTCSLLRRAISPEFKLEHSAPAQSVPVLAVEGKLAQVVVNLVINSRDALKPGGKIEVRVEECRDCSELQRVLGSSELPCASYVILIVRDNGHGMPGEVMERIFEPYFSTKKDKGTGLGLATVASIVRALGGAIEVKSEVNVGTETRVFLPVIEGDMQEEETVRQAAQHKLETGNENILVIDDEYAVRNVLSLSLQHLGYTVAVACSGSEALEKYGGGQRDIDLVILDMLMPHLSGEQVFFQLKRQNPAVKVLLISGYASEEAVANVLKNGGLDFIQKPFTIEELAKRVRDCLDCGSAGGQTN